ncbi:MAG: 50S ribosome-binding GTPase, partial [Lachnospiraceae bacterium]|nr:50S ribosome-binding GTPase [Lachnospiraceae bacterium]
GEAKVERHDENDETKRFFELIRDTLEDNEVSGKYARALLGEIEKLNKPGVTIDYLLSNIYQKMVLKFGETKLIRKSGKNAEVIFFVGPTGVGKTTTIAKIASKFCVADKASVALITTDTYRVKAAEQLRTYADILDVPFRIIYEQEDMTEALKEFQNYDYILVDTAGHSPQNNEQIENQKQFIETAEALLPVQVYLVLSVTTKYRDLLHIVDQYKRDKGYRLIFTKLDETMALGNMLNLKIYTGADVSYVTNGQDVPDDIQEFNAQRIVRTLLDTK